MASTKRQPPCRGGFNFSSPSNHPGWVKATRPIRVFLDNTLRTWNDLDRWGEQHGYGDNTLRQGIAWLEGAGKIRSLKGKTYVLESETAATRGGECDVYWVSTIPLALEEQALGITPDEEVGEHGSDGEGYDAGESVVNALGDDEEVSSSDDQEDGGKDEDDEDA